MGKITEPEPVKLFVGMLSQETPLIEELLRSLTDIFGPADLQSPLWSWRHTRYYEAEMGSGLTRKFIFFEKLMEPDDITGTKLLTGDLEKKYPGDSGGRRINLDPGYLNAAKLVLVSTKDFSHRIYLGRGIYGEVTLVYSGGRYRELPYTYPDFRTDEYINFFTEARKIFKSQICKKPCNGGKKR